MQDSQVTINRLIKEHRQALDGVRECDVLMHELSRLRQKSNPAASPELKQKLASLEEALGRLSEGLQAHMHSEEEQLLPVLIEHAVALVTRGVVSDQKMILDSIAEVREGARDLVEKPAKHEEAIASEAHVRAWVDRVMRLLEQHTHTQEVVFGLARETLAVHRQQGRHSESKG